MTTSDRIRELASTGMSVADIARSLGIRYQQAYQVCRTAGLITPKTSPSRDPVTPKPALLTDRLLAGGFRRVGEWTSDGVRLSCAAELPKSAGVYAFTIDNRVQYVGLASRSLAQRLYFYGRPGVSQRTNIRLNMALLSELASGRPVHIYVAEPPSQTWNDFEISGPAGLEAGLIKSFALPWNSRGN